MRTRPRSSSQQRSSPASPSLWCRSRCSGAESATSAVCAYVAVTIAATAWLLAFASFSANWEPLGLKERYTFYVEPVVLMALPLWLCRGAFRGRLGSSLIALGLTALVVTLPLERILAAPALIQSYSFLGLSSWANARGTVGP